MSTTKVTPLLRFLRALTEDQRKEVARNCETTKVYLYQLAAQPWPNPKLSLAMKLVAESQRLAPKVMTEPLSFEDLLVGTSDEPVSPNGHAN